MVNLTCVCPTSLLFPSCALRKHVDLTLILALALALALRNPISDLDGFLRKKSRGNKNKQAIIGKIRELFYYTSEQALQNAMAGRYLL